MVPISDHGHFDCLIILLPSWPVNSHALSSQFTSVPRITHAPPQALVVPISDHGRAAATGALYRAATGCDRQRLATLCSVLDKHVPTLALAACSVIVNVVGGVQVGCCVPYLNRINRSMLRCVPV